MFTSPRVDFRCESCDCTYDVSYRHANEIRRLNKKRICPTCRQSAQIVVTDELKWWWRRRFAEADCVVMAEAIWGPVEDWPPRTNPELVDFSWLTAALSAKVPRITDN